MLCCLSLHSLGVVDWQGVSLQPLLPTSQSQDRELLSVVNAAEMKQAVTAFLVRECGGQFKRPFPIRASDQSDDDYNCRLQHWLYEKARSVILCGEQLLAVIVMHILHPHHLGEPNS